MLHRGYLLFIIKYIYNLIHSFKNNHSNSVTIPTYAFSVIIVCILLYFSYRISDFTIDDLTDTLVSGNYLAFPIAAIVAVALFFILVQIIHATILLLNGKKSTDISQFMRKLNVKLKLSEKISNIVEGLVGIILDTIIHTISFVKFIPSFFGSLSRMVLDEEDFYDSKENDDTQQTSDKEPEELDNK